MGYHPQSMIDGHAGKDLLYGRLWNSLAWADLVQAGIVSEALAFSCPHSLFFFQGVAGSAPFPGKKHHVIWQERHGVYLVEPHKWTEEQEMTILL